MLRRLSLISALILSTACTQQSPLTSIAAPVGLLQTAATPRSTQGALNLIEAMAHANPQEYAQIEAAFDVEIRKSTRPSLKKILAKAAEAISHHPQPGMEPAKHPVARLIRLAAWRFNWLMGENLIARVFELFAIFSATPDKQPALVKAFETHIRNTPKLDTKIILQSFQEGHYDDLAQPGSPLRVQLEAILKARMAY